MRPSGESPWIQRHGNLASLWGRSEQRACVPAAVNTVVNIRREVRKHPYISAHVSDVSYCTFTDVILDEPFLYNVGLGSQTVGGHHAGLQYTTTPVEPGTRKCDQSEMDGQILIGGTGGKTVGTPIEVPPEIAVEIPAGAQFIINHHYINTTIETVDGQALMIARAHNHDEMILAGQVIMGSMGGELPAQANTTDATEVVFQDDTRVSSGSEVSARSSACGSLRCP
jgi:hypothetical protein